MKKSLLLSCAAMAAFAMTALAQTPAETLPLGAKLPMADTKMKSIDDDMYAVRDMMGENGVLVIFTCNTCPFVIGAEGYGGGWEGRYPSVIGAAKKTDVGIILVNSNEAKREKGDNLADMKAQAEAGKYDDIPYVLDQNSALANAFGARTTPHVFLFDKNMNLVYRGSIDDSNESPDKVKEPYLFNALGNLAAGKKIEPADTKPVGCSIKRVQ